jgi:pimeloyl-ACP methyl ester carboxylesterase
VTTVTDTRIRETTAPDGTRIAFAVAGEGEPVLLVHGTSGCHQMWRFQIEEYARNGFQAIAIDLRGGGYSDAPADEARYSVELMARDAVAVLDELGIEAAHVSGHSLGGAITLRMALDHADRVRSVQAHGAWARSDEYLKRIFFEPMLNAIERRDLHNNFRYGLALVMSPVYLETRAPAEVAEVISEVFTRNPNPITPEGFRGHLVAGRGHDVLDRLGEIEAPILVAAGEIDANIPPRYSVEVAAHLRDAHLHIFRGPRAAHCPNLEMADEFNAITMEFMNQRRQETT